MVGSKVLKANSKYHVSVSSHGYDETQKLEVSITGDKVVEGRKKIVNLSGNNTEILEYDVSATK